MARWLRRSGLALALALALFVAAVLITSRAGDRTLWPAAPGDPTNVVYVVSHGYHAGIVIPRALSAEIAEQRRLTAVRAVTQRFAQYPWLEIGWGDEGFYTQAPTLASVTVPLALRALFRAGNPSVLHVVGIDGEARGMFPHADIVQVDLTERGFERLLARIDSTFARASDGMVDELRGGIYGPSLFYRAVGAFNLLKVCNHWIADLLDAGGVPTAPVLATLPDGLLLDLKWRGRLRPLPPHKP